MNSSDAIYFEDLHINQIFDCGSLTLETPDLIDFAHRFDPQVFHLDAQLAQQSIFKGLAASGWHTCALSMRLLSQSDLARIHNGLVGLSIDQLRWPTPTRPNDTLHLKVTVLETKRSRSQPNFGVVTLLWQTSNQNGELLMSLHNNIWVATRGTSAMDTLE